jgi:predicted RNA-binding Zn-ribbon protein involved in translation (DUF1610 family)
MHSGLNIQDGVYIEEPVRMRVDLPVIRDGGFIFDGKNVWRKQNRQRPPYIEYEAIRTHRTSYAKFRCNWCGSTQTMQLNRETVSQRCPNCGGPR